MHGLRKLLREIHRRAVWQVALAYLVLAWVLLVAGGRISWRVGLPDWVGAATFVLLAVGFPVVVLTAVVQRGVPALRGEYRDEVDPNELRGLTPAEVHVVPRAHPLHRERVFTWANAVLGGVCAAALLVSSVVAYLGMWAAGIGPMGSLVARGVLTPGEELVVADFGDAAGGELGEAVSGALRLGLAGGPILRIADDDTGSADGLVLAGEVVDREGGYLVRARLHRGPSGPELAGFEASSPDGDGLLEALDDLVADIRERSGESLRSVRTRGGIGATATPSMEALRLFARGRRARRGGDEASARRLFEEALAADPGFAQARAALGDGPEGQGPVP